MKRIFVATTLFLATVPTITMAQTAGKFAWQTVEDRLKASQSVAALSPHFASLSVSGIFDKQGLQGGAITVGPGVDASGSTGKTWTLSIRSAAEKLKKYLED